MLIFFGLRPKSGDAVIRRLYKLKFILKRFVILYIRHMHAGYIHILLLATTTRLSDNRARFQSTSDYLMSLRWRFKANLVYAVELDTA